MREADQIGQASITYNLGTYQAAVDAALAKLDEQRVVARIWQHDHTIWKPQPTEITNRLGWLHIAQAMQNQLPRLKALVAEVRVAGYTDVLLLGMGGSSLAAELFGKTFVGRIIEQPAGPPLSLAVLDSTDPGAVLAYAERLDPARTLFVVSTKSGGTAETLSFFKFFYNWTLDALGEEEAGEHFIAITDPGSRLVGLAERHSFRTTFLNDPNIGGRFSALSYFGLVPAALVGVNTVGVDVAQLLDRAIGVILAGRPCAKAAANPAVCLGAILGVLAQAGRDKVTFAVSHAVASFGDWVEQLIAESTGKEGLGILPVVGEPLGAPEVYGDDRLFVHLRLAGDDAVNDAELSAIAALEAAGHPVVRIALRDAYDLGGQFFLWEFATAVAGHLLDINPFNQPNVESAKVQARKMIAEYQDKGALPGVESAPLTGQVLADFLAQAQEGSYIALQAYVQPTSETTKALAKLRLKLRDRYRLATTVGYGPCFLHSTGQLHKGDAGNGLFIQFTADPPRNAAIPDEAGRPESAMTFGVLISAQALGDRQALLDNDRPVIRFHLGDDVVGALEKLGEAF